MRSGTAQLARAAHEIYDATLARAHRARRRGLRSLQWRIVQFYAQDGIWPPSVTHAQRGKWHNANERLRFANSIEIRSPPSLCLAAWHKQLVHNDEGVQTVRPIQQLEHYLSGCRLIPANENTLGSALSSAQRKAYMFASRGSWSTQKGNGTGRNYLPFRTDCCLRATHICKYGVKSTRAGN